MFVECAKAVLLNVKVVIISGCHLLRNNNSNFYIVMAFSLLPTDEPVDIRNFLDFFWPLL